MTPGRVLFERVGMFSSDDAPWGADPPFIAFTCTHRYIYILIYILLCLFLDDLDLSLSVSDLIFPSPTPSHLRPYFPSSDHFTLPDNVDAASIVNQPLGEVAVLHHELIHHIGIGHSLLQKVSPSDANLLQPKVFSFAFFQTR